MAFLISHAPDFDKKSKKKRYIVRWLATGILLSLIERDL
jgi:hypothetical protein